MDAGGQHNASGGQCYARVMVTFSLSGGKSFCDYANQKPITAVWADTSIMKGSATARWYKGPASFAWHCDGAGKPPCYTYTRTHVVTVTPVAAALVLVPSRYVTHPGKGSVTFTASRTPTMFGPHSIPFTVQSWAWAPDSGSATGPNCAASTTCAYTPATSGTMTLTALVNGTVQTKSVHIRVLCAPTGNPLLDSLPALDGLKAAWDSSHPDGPAINRRERYFTVQCDASGCTYTVVPGDPSDTPCQAQPPTSDTTGTRRAGGHTHPFTPGPGPLPLSEQLPSNCGVPPGWGAAPRPSPGDLAHIVGPGAGLPHYVIDRKNIYSTPFFVGVDTTALRQLVNPTARKLGACTIL